MIAASERAVGNASIDGSARLSRCPFERSVLVVAVDAAGGSGTLLAMVSGAPALLRPSPPERAPAGNGAALVLAKDRRMRHHDDDRVADRGHTAGRGVNAVNNDGEQRCRVAV